MTPRVRPCGETALLVECAGLAEAVALAARVRDAADPVVLDVVPAARTVLLGCGDAADLPALRRVAAAALAEPTVAEGESLLVTGREVTLDVRYDGPDLTEVAREAGLTPEELARRHLAVPWVAAFGGFAPGFCYLVDERELGETGSRGGVAGAADGLPTVPRLESPRTRVPAGSVALADRWCGVYPDASPGGWRLVGRTDAVLWDTGREPPALLEPGVRVRFREIKP